MGGLFAEPLNGEWTIDNYELRILNTNTIMSEDSKKLNKRSYNLHYKIRKQGFKLQTRRKLIFTGTQELTAQVIKLNKEFKYVLQPSLF